MPRGTAPDVSDDGYLVDPESPHSIYARVAAVPFEALADFPVLGLLGEQGMRKSTVLRQEAGKIQAAARETGDRLLHVDLTACGTDVIVCQRIFDSKEFRAWKRTNGPLHLFLDGFDTCLQYVENLVGLLLDRFDKEPLDGMSVRLACRTTKWPQDLEEGLQRLWGRQAVGIYELAPCVETTSFE